MFIRAPSILLVDDDLLFRRQMAAYLELWGARVLEADDVSQGLWLAGRRMPDLVVGNLMMPTPEDEFLVSLFRHHFPALRFVAVSRVERMAGVAMALRAGAVDYLIKPVRDWRAVKRRLTASLEASPAAVWRELNELESHLRFYRGQDIAITRLLQGLQPLPAGQLGEWRLSCRYSSPWVLTQYLRLGRDLLLLAAEFDPLHRDSPMLMLLVAFLLNEPLRRYREETDNILRCPARTLAYINGWLMDTGLQSRVSLMLLRLNAGSNTMEVANGGMAGSDWLERCNAGPLGQGGFTASAWCQPCDYPLQLSLSGQHGGRIELTASPVSY